jgi:hypothetical protein
MCRFLVSTGLTAPCTSSNSYQVYKGSDEILLSKLILDPAHSILIQSFDPRLRLDMTRPHNGKPPQRSMLTATDLSSRRWIRDRILHQLQAWPRALHLYLYYTSVELRQSTTNRH